MMVTEKDIRKFIRDNKISVPKDDAFMEDLVRQINQLPIPARLSESDHIQENLRILKTVREALRKRHRKQAIRILLCDMILCATIFLVGYLLLPTEAAVSSPVLSFIVTWRYLILGVISVGVVMTSYKNIWQTTI